ncbi:hypothetical protein [Catenuloplanes indicus]|uniref:Uncharacterized protein n=1 Tax=Catenuloplanes indicus TaxID=137267 RepID=A0AAE3WAD5_9ACTN|nr:hypothetical protein [Catenuloplanes indicus]MDQ0371564.1 hypothetical protein [Catenuloplanes indicus]
MRCVKHGKLICFSAECRGEKRWQARPVPRLTAPSQSRLAAAPKAATWPDGLPKRPTTTPIRPSTPRAAHDDLNDPVSPIHQATYGGAFWGASDAPDRCTPPTESSTSSSPAGYDGGSSGGGYSSSSDNGSSSSPSCGGGE